MARFQIDARGEQQTTLCLICKYSQQRSFAPHTDNILPKNPSSPLSPIDIPHISIENQELTNEINSPSCYMIWAFKMMQHNTIWSSQSIAGSWCLCTSTWSNRKEPIEQFASFPAWKHRRTKRHHEMTSRCWISITGLFGRKHHSSLAPSAQRTLSCQSRLDRLVNFKGPKV